MICNRNPKLLSSLRTLMNLKVWLINNFEQEKESVMNMQFDTVHNKPTEIFFRVYLKIACKLRII